MNYPAAELRGINFYNTNRPSHLSRDDLTPFGYAVSPPIRGDVRRTEGSEQWRSEKSVLKTTPE